MPVAPLPGGLARRQPAPTLTTLQARCAARGCAGNARARAPPERPSAHHTPRHDAHANDRTERKAHGTRTELCFRRNAAKQRRPKPKVKMSSAIRKHRRAETRETRVFAAT